MSFWLFNWHYKIGHFYKASLKSVHHELWQWTLCILGCIGWGGGGGGGGSNTYTGDGKTWLYIYNMYQCILLHEIFVRRRSIMTSSFTYVYPAKYSSLIWSMMHTTNLRVVWAFNIYHWFRNTSGQQRNNSFEDIEGVYSCHAACYLSNYDHQRHYSRQTECS